MAGEPSTPRQDSAAVSLIASYGASSQTFWAVELHTACMASAARAPSCNGRNASLAVDKSSSRPDRASGWPAGPRRRIRSEQKSPSIASYGVAKPVVMEYRTANRLRAFSDASNPSRIIVYSLRK